MEADNYTLQLSETIFELAELSEVENADELFKLYLNYLKGVKVIDFINEPEKLMQLADEINNQLLDWKENFVN